MDALYAALFSRRDTLPLFAPLEGINLYVTYASPEELLLESFGEGGRLVLITEHGISEHREQYFVPHKAAQYRLGHSAREVLDAGEDILGNALLGKPLADYIGVLPPFGEGAYLSLGFHASQRALTVDLDGRVYLQGLFHGEWHPGSHPTADWSPGELGLYNGRLGFLDGEIPLLSGLFETAEGPCEVRYLTEIQDVTDDRHGYVTGDCAMWLRLVYFGGEQPRAEYYSVGLTGEHLRIPLAGEVFSDCLVGELLYYERYLASMACITLPEDTLTRAYRGCMLQLDGLFAGQARYGSRYYAFETHKNFPPNYITALSALCMSGKCTGARLLYDEFLVHSVDPRGKIIYRQGKAQRHGASGSEYGQLLWVFARFRDILAPHGQTPEHKDAIAAMAGFLTRQISLSPEAGVPLVRMCAEADSNERVYDYLQNTLWAIRGLEGAAALLGAEGQFAADVAKALRESMETVYWRYRTETKWGSLVPFHLGYPALPLTLSRCRAASVPVTEDALERYYAGGWDGRTAVGDGQEYFENTYANYRYYGEMLSSGLLPEDIAEAIRAMRRAIGGELLSMTRFAGGLDDWPVWNYGVDLLESGDRERFYQLLCAHTLFHGLEDFHTYFEQVRFTNESAVVMGDASVGCLLAPPLLVLMGLCWEQHDGSLALLRGIPAHILRQGLSFSGIHACGGTVSLRLTPEGELTVSLTGIFCPVHIDLPDKTVFPEIPGGSGTFTTRI